MGIEPTNDGFADRCVTTSPPCQTKIRIRNRDHVSKPPYLFFRRSCFAVIETTHYQMFLEMLIYKARIASARKTTEE